MRHDRRAYINTARQRTRDLEDLLGSDLIGHGKERDAGWDGDSVREELGGRPDGDAAPRPDGPSTRKG